MYFERNERVLFEIGFRNAVLHQLVQFERGEAQGENGVRRLHGADPDLERSVGAAQGSGWGSKRNMPRGKYSMYA